MLCFICITSILFASCLKDDCETVALPTKIGQIPESVVSSEMQSQLSQYMNLYTGTTPPEIEGNYRVSPCQPIYSSDGYIDDIFYDMLLSVENQSERSIVVYSETQQSATIRTTTARIIGEAPNFTLFDQVKVTNLDEGWTYDATIVISGTSTSGGIKDIHYAFIMGAREGNTWMLAPEGSWRVFIDGDTFSPKQ